MVVGFTWHKVHLLPALLLLTLVVVDLLVALCVEISTGLGVEKTKYHG